MQDFFELMIKHLAEAQVEFVVVGGASAVLQGAPIVTGDLDLCYHRTPENLTRLASALAPFNPRLRGIPPELSVPVDERTLSLGTNFTLMIGNENLDLLGEMSAIGGYTQIIQHADEMEVGGYRIKVLPLSQLILTKEA